MSPIVQSVVLFLLAGLAEIGGGYLVWLWLRDQRSVYIGLLGFVVLIIYGIIPTFQQASFARTYAAYGGVFIILSLLWGWAFDGQRPDGPEIVGGAICLVGVAIIMYWPRA